MKNFLKALSFLTLFLLNYSFSFSQCNYLLNNFDQEVHFLNDPTGLSLNTISNCSSYQITYTISASLTSGTDISSVFSIQLPLGMSYEQQLTPTSSNVSYLAGSNIVQFQISNWNPTNALEITIEASTPSCDFTNPSINGLASLTDANGCYPSMNTNSALLSAVSDLNVFNVAGSSPILKNVGEIGELVFNIQNLSIQGTIDAVHASLQNESTIQLLGNYYLSTSSSSPSGNTIYNFTLPSPVPNSIGILNTLLPGNTLNLTSTEWNYFFNVPYLPAQSELYLHVPYKVVSCDFIISGAYSFDIPCANGNCSNSTTNSNIQVATGNPSVVVSAYPFTSDGTYCENVNSHSFTAGFTMANGNSGVLNAPYGSGKATDLILYVGLDPNWGDINTNSIVIKANGNTMAIPSSLVTTEPPYLYSGELYTVYKIDFTSLAVTGSNPIPLGLNTIGDFDGDGKLDDLNENSSFDIDFTYNYIEGCHYAANPRGYDLIRMVPNFNNQCYNILPTSYAQIGYSPYNPNSGVYAYQTGAGATVLDLPSDVIEGTPFAANLCFAPHTENFVGGFDFDCPQGYHRVQMNVPVGYHLNTSVLTPSSVAGWYDLPAIIATALCIPNNQTLNPIIKETCNPGLDGSVIEIRFGRIMNGNECGGPTLRTYQLPCFDVPLLIECTPLPTDPCPTIPPNYGFDNFDFTFDFVCDELCESCASPMGNASSSTFHHCDGPCDAYFDTQPDFTLTRTSLGYSNPQQTEPVDCNYPGPTLQTASPSVINLKAGYPSDLVAVHSTGKFITSPPTLPSVIGTNFNSIFFQLRYEQFAPGIAAQPDVFALEPSATNGIVITDNLNNIIATVPASALIVTTNVTATSPAIVEINFQIPTSVYSSLNGTNQVYTMTADFDVRIKHQPAVSFDNFFAMGEHKLLNLRAEWRGVENNNSQTERRSCDDYGNKFAILQPFSQAPIFPNYPMHTTCDPYDASFFFRCRAAKFGISDDFKNEHRAYMKLDSNLVVKIPAGYNYISSTIVFERRVFNPSAPNDFDINLSQFTMPISGEVVNTTATQTIVDFSGAYGLANDCWPEMDLNVLNDGMYVFVKIQPTCTAPASDSIEIIGRYRKGIQQPDPLYQKTVSFKGKVPIFHYNPLLTLNEPATTIDALSGSVSFPFSVCTNPLNNIYNINPSANQAWVAFENSIVNGLDLSTASVIDVQTGLPINFNTYTDPNGYTAIIANLGAIPANSCYSFVLNVQVNGNGCVPSNSLAVIDQLHVLFGNSCSGQPLLAPAAECLQDQTTFEFKRFPSNIELIAPSDAYPELTVDLCNGTLNYHFIVNSSDIGSLTEPEFWVNLPAGIQLVSGTFNYPYGSANNYTVTAFDGNTFGPTNSFLGWAFENHFSIPTFPGTTNVPLNQIGVSLTFQSTCDYSTTTPLTFQAGAISSCNVFDVTSIGSDIPTFVNMTAVNDIQLSSQVVYSNTSNSVGCFDQATVLFTFTNNSSVSNITNLYLTTNFQDGLFNYIPTGGFVIPNGAEWHFSAGSIPAGSSTTVALQLSDVALGSCINDFPISSLIDFEQAVDCAANGNTCFVNLTTNPTTTNIDFCCECNLAITSTTTNSLCNLSNGSIDTDISGSNGNYTVSWSNGATSDDISNLAANTYVITVTDEMNCTATASIPVAADQNPIDVSASLSSSTICSGFTSTMSLFGANSYTIFDGTTTQTTTSSSIILSPSQTTTYTITGVDINGCSGTTTVTLNVNPTPIITVNNESICSGQSALLIASGATNYSWSPSATLSTATGSTTTATPSITTTYSVVGTTNGCSNSATATVTVNPIPTVNAVQDELICANSLFSGVTFSGSLPGTQYNWTNSDPSIGLAASGTGNINSFTILNPTFVTITATITVTPELNGCTGTPITFTITVNPTPSVNVPVSTTICAGTFVNPITLTGSNPAAHYYWMNSLTSIGLPASGTDVIPGFTAVNNTTNPIIAEISIRPYIGDCFGTIETYTITVNPTPNTQITGDLSICVGESTILTASGASSYSWNTGATSPSITVSPITTTTYNVTGTNTYGCSSNQSATVVVTNCNPCENVIATLSYTVSNCIYYFQAGVIAGATYEWKVDGGAWFTGSSNLALPLSLGNHTVCVRVTKVVDGVTCTDTICKTFLNKCVSPIGKPCDVTANFTRIFTGPLSVLFNNTSSYNPGLPVTFIWSFGDGTYSNAMSPTHVYASSGTYQACLWVIQGTCIKKYCKMIVIFPSFPGGPKKIIVAPNPVSKQATITIEEIQDGPVRVSIYNFMGQQIDELYNNDQHIGETLRLEWTPKDIAPGTYIIKVEYNEGVEIEKIEVLME